MDTVIFVEQITSSNFAMTPNCGKRECIVLSVRTL